MINYLVTGGCSFSVGWGAKNWPYFVENFVKEKYTTRIFNPVIIHTGMSSQGQELIQKKVTMQIMDLLDRGVDPEEILVVVMWSGTYRKAWYIDNPGMIEKIVDSMKFFRGGMSPLFLDLYDKDGGNPKTFKTASGDDFRYNPNGGWYFTVNGSDCPVEFVQQHYILDGWQTQGVGKVHTSLENIVMLQNFCKLKGVKLVQQFYMDHVYRDIEQHKDHQIINYLYRQLDHDMMIKPGMFETLHELVGVSRAEATDITHDRRRELSGTTDIFNKDGFHPGVAGSEYWFNNVLLPFLESKQLT
jgi:hypothetical protein